MLEMTLRHGISAKSASIRGATKKPQRPDAHRFDRFHFFRDLHRAELGGVGRADPRRQHDPGEQAARAHG